MGERLTLHTGIYFTEAAFHVLNAAAWRSFDNENMLGLYSTLHDTRYEHYCQPLFISHATRDDVKLHPDLMSTVYSLVNIAADGELYFSGNFEETPIYEAMHMRCLITALTHLEDAVNENNGTNFEGSCVKAAEILTGLTFHEIVKKLCNFLKTNKMEPSDEGILFGRPLTNPFAQEFIEEKLNELVKYHQDCINDRGCVIQQKFSVIKRMMNEIFSILKTETNYAN